MRRAHYGQSFLVLPHAEGLLRLTGKIPTAKALGGITAVLVKCQPMPRRFYSLFYQPSSGYMADTVLDPGSWINVDGSQSALVSAFIQADIHDGNYSMHVCQCDYCTCIAAKGFVKAEGAIYICDHCECEQKLG